MTALPENYLEHMKNGIVGIGLEVTRLEGKQKLSQNQTPADQRGEVAQLETGASWSRAWRRECD